MQAVARRLHQPTKAAFAHVCVLCVSIGVMRLRAKLSLLFFAGNFVLAPPLLLELRDLPPGTRRWACGLARKYLLLLLFIWGMGALSALRVQRDMC